MRACSCCGKPVTITEQSRFRTVVYEDNGEPCIYLGMFECSCQSTLSVVLWQDEQASLDEHRDRIEAEEAAELDRAAARPFFSTALELVELGL